MTRARVRASCAGVLALGLAALPACERGDPQTAVLEERARHSAEVTSWSRRDDGTLVVGVRVQGPVHSTLDVLTVEVQGRDADDRVVLTEWVTLDLSAMVRGTPFEQHVILHAGDTDPEGVAVLLHPQPGPDVLPRLVELEGVR